MTPGFPGDVACVFVCPETPMPYFNEYSTYVDESDCLTIASEDLVG